MHKNAHISSITVIVVVAVCAVVLSIYYFASSVAHPYMGVRLSKNTGHWEVSVVDPNGAAVRSGIHVGDVPVVINGIPASAFLSTYEEYGTVYSFVVTSLQVVNSQQQTISVELVPGQVSRGSLIESISFFITSVIFILIGVFVFFKKPRNKAARLLFLTSLCFGIAINATNAAPRLVPTALTVEAVASSIGPWLLFHFLLVLPNERDTGRKDRKELLGYLVPLIILVMLPFVGYSNGQPTPWFRDVRLLGYAAGFASAIGIAIYNYVKYSSIRTRQQMKIVSLSCFAALIPFLFLSVLPEAISQETLLPSGTSILFISFIPLGLGYAVVTQKLMDIDVLIRRGVTYGLISFLLAVVLSLGIFLIDQFQRSYSIAEEVLLALGLGVVSAIIFGPIKNTVERFVDRVFYKDRYEYRQIIQGLSGALNATKEFNEVSRLLVGTAASTLNLAGACLWTRTSPGEYELGAAQGIFTNPEILEQSLTTVREQKVEVNFPNTVSPNSESIAFIIPLKSGDREIGTLCLSPKASRQDYSPDDIFLIQGLVAVGTIALQSSLLVHDVSVQQTFVSIASHEMRTPLTSISGYTELLLKRTPDESQRERWLNIILRNSQRITVMVNELLDVSRIHSGRVDLNVEKVKFSEILDEVLALAEHTSAKHRVKVNAAENLPPLYTDKNKCIQILWNLINNAIKYSPEGGGVRINAWEAREKAKVVISVRDEGIGISKEDQEKLFTTFFRIKRPETIGVPGSGLGLYISKKWIELMRGEIWVESQINQGSTFYISLPTDAL